MKKNTWNVKRLVDDSFVPSAQRPSVLYSRLTVFKALLKTVASLTVLEGNLRYTVLEFMGKHWAFGSTSFLYVEGFVRNAYLHVPLWKS